MAGRTDKEYADRYEEDMQWYKNYCNHPQDNSITEGQLYTIKQIEDRSPLGLVKFRGTTKASATEFINEYGDTKYNENSYKKHTKGRY